MAVNILKKPQAIKVRPDGRVSARDAARYLGEAEKTLANHRSLGIGPPWTKLGRRVWYYLRDLENWVTKHAKGPAKAPPLQEATPITKTMTETVGLAAGKDTAPSNITPESFWAYVDANFAHPDWK